MHHLQQEHEQIHGADGDMGEGMVDDDEGEGEGDDEYGELGDMTEAEYRALVAEQARLAQEQGEDEDGEEALTEEQLGQLREAFDACDADKDGALSKPELDHLLMSIGGQLDDDVAERLMQVADANGDGKLSFEEFVNAL